MSPQFDRKYLCPLCLRDFAEGSIRGEQPELTEEHCIPKRLGRNIFVLTCASCNHESGYSVDAHLGRRLRFEQFWNGSYDEAVPARLEIAGHQLAVNVRRTGGQENKTDMIVVKRASDDKAILAAQQLMKREPPISEVKLHFGPHETPDIRRSRISLLKTAYLLMFRRFGYSYILNKELEPIRQQIRDPHAKVLPMAAIVLEPPSDRDSHRRSQ